MNTTNTRNQALIAHSRGSRGGPITAASVPQLIADSWSTPPAEVRQKLAITRHELAQPISPKRLTQAVSVLGMVLKWPGDGVIVDREVFLTGLNQAIRDRGYAEPVVNEAMRRLRDNERWMPAISEVLATCEAVSEEWSRKIADAEREARERARREAQEEYERECERDPGKRWRDRIAELEQVARKNRVRRQRLEADKRLRSHPKLIMDLGEEIEKLDEEQVGYEADMAEMRRRLGSDRR